MQNMQNVQNLFSMIEVLNIVTSTVLITLASYHLLIFLGCRVKRKELYHLYFTIFLTNLALWIFIHSIVYQHIEDAFPLLFKISTVFEILLFFCFMYSCIGFMSCLIGIKRRFEQLFLFCYGLLAVDLAIALLRVFNMIDHDAHIDPVTVTIGASSFILMLGFFTYRIIIDKVYKKRVTMLIYSGFFVIIMLFLVEEFLLSIYVKELLSSNYIFIGLFAFLFVYTLTVRYNKTYDRFIRLRDDFDDEVLRRTNEFEHEKKEMDAKYAQLSDLFVNLSHETKIPLTLISNYLDQVIKNHNVVGDLQVVRHYVDRLKRDMVNLLDIEQMKSGRIHYNHNMVVNISDVLNNELILFEEAAQKKNIRFEKRIMPGIYSKIDPGALDSIINNLLDNALKYTESGGTIKVRLKREGVHVRFIVADSGIGMSKVQLDNIFKPYYQAVCQNRKITGIGIGLTITARIINEIQGTIKIKSKVNTGTTCRVSLKAHNLQLTDTVDTEYQYTNLFDYPRITLAEESYDSSRNTVLIVDNNIELLAYLQKNLIDKFNVFYAFNGKQALIKLKALPLPDIIISDLVLPGMDGYEFYDNLASHNEYKYIPFIFITAHKDEQSKIKALNRGAIDFIYKPFNFEEVKAKVVTVIQQKKAERERNLHEFEKKILTMLKTVDTKEFPVQVPSPVMSKDITVQEKEIIDLLVNGYVYKEISSILDIPMSTTKKRIRMIYKKFEVQNKIELIRIMSNV